MVYREYQPSPALRSFVKCYWSLAAAPTARPESERVVPDGSMEMIFHYGDHFERRDKETFTRQSRHLVCGQIDRFLELRPTGEIGIFAMRFRPAGAFPFLGVPCGELATETVSLENVWADFDAVADAMSSAKGDQSRIALADRILESVVPGIKSRQT